MKLRLAVSIAFAFAAGWTFGPSAIDYARAQSCNSASGFVQLFGTIPIGDLVTLGPDCNHVQDGGPNTGSLTPTFRSVTITPVPFPGLNSALTINQALTGNAGATNWNSLNISSDDVNGSFLADWNDTHLYGGPNAKGSRVGALYYMIQTAATSATNPSRAYVGITSVSQSNTGDGGSGLSNVTALGTYFGGNLIGRNAGPNVYQNIGAEFDTMTTAGSTQRYNMGISTANYSASQGSAVDAAWTIYTGNSVAASGGSGPWGPGVGYGMAICLCELGGNGLSPISTGGSIIDTHFETLSSFTMDHAFNLASVVFTNYFLQAPGITISKNGVVDVNRNANPLSVNAIGPNSGVRYSGVDGTLSNIVINSYGNVSAFIGARTANTAASKVNVGAGDVLSQFSGLGWTTGGAFSGQIAAERITAAETFTSTTQGSFIDWITTKIGTLVTAAQMKLDGYGHIEIGQGILVTAANLSACGAGPAISATANDVHGTITMGTGTTGCTLTFANVRAVAPDCVAIDATGTLAAMSVTVNSSTLVIAGAAASNKITYNCIGI